jgi:hypothetical protein
MPDFHELISMYLDTCNERGLMKWLQMIKVLSKPQVDVFVRKCNMRYMDHSVMSAIAIAANADKHTVMLLLTQIPCERI